MTKSEDTPTDGGQGGSVDLTNLQGAVALVGPNGCGKTVLLEGLVGLRPQNTIVQAETLVAFRSIIPKDRFELGFSFQHQRFAERLKVRDIIHFHHDIYSRPDAKLEEAFSLTELSNRRYGMLSGGEKKRLNLFFALNHKPKVAFLDEPEAELDSVHKSILGQVLKDRTANGLTTVYSSHDPEVIELANRCCCLSNRQITVWNSVSAAISAIVGKSVLVSNAEEAKQARSVLTDIGLSTDIIAELRSIDGSNLFCLGRSIDNLRHRLADASAPEGSAFFQTRQTRFSDLMLALSHRVVTR